MLKNISRYIVPSILLGMIITICYLASMTWHSVQNCQDNYDGKLSVAIQTVVSDRIPRVDCAGLAYGYPFKYVQSEAHVNFSLAPPSASHDSQLFMGIAGQTKWAVGNFIADVIV